MHLQLDTQAELAQTSSESERTCWIIARRAADVLRFLTVAIAAAVLLAPSAKSQTPTVQIINNTRGGSTVFYVGDTWTVTISGGAADAEVVVSIPGSSSPVGYTNVSGTFMLSGYMSAGDVGTWNETWTVGGVTATPDPLTFYVYPASASTCDLVAEGSTGIFSLDYVDSYWPHYLVYQALGYTWVAGALDPAGYCVMYSDTVDLGSLMYAARTILTPYLDQWEIGDAGGYRPGYDPDIGPEAYYPYVDATGVGFVAINVTNGDLYFVPIVVGLLVDYIYY